MKLKTGFRVREVREPIKNIYFKMQAFDLSSCVILIVWYLCKMYILPMRDDLGLNPGGIGTFFTLYIESRGSLKFREHKMNSCYVVSNKHWRHYVRVEQ